MRNIILFVCLLAVTGCKSEYDVYLEKRAAGVRWIHDGFYVVANGTNYPCMSYRIENALMGNNKGGLLASPAVQAVGTANPKFRIITFSGKGWDGVVINDFSCDGYHIERAKILSKHKWEVEL